MSSLENSSSSPARDLDNLIEMEITVSDKHYTIRSDTAGTVAKVFSGCGVALPPLLSQC